MTGESHGSQTGKTDSLRFAASASLTLRDDLAAVAADSSAIAFDGLAFIVKGLRYLELEADFAEPVSGARAASRLSEGDNARRCDRAALLRALAALVERGGEPTTDELESALPEAIKDRLLLSAIKQRLRTRAADLDRNPTRAVGDPARYRLPTRQANGAIALARRIKFAALSLFAIRHPDN